MLDIKFVRDNAELVRQGAIKKRFPERAEAVDKALELDAELRRLIPDLDGLRSRQKSAAKAVGKLSAAERERHLEEQRRLRDDVQRLEERERELRLSLRQQLMLIPSPPAPEVPDGGDDRENVEVRRVGEIPHFPFPLRPHHELAEAQGWLEVARAGLLSGSRNYYLLGELALLHDAVLRFGVDALVAKGYVPVDPPLLVRDVAMEGTAFFPGGEEQTYRCEKDGLNLIGTAEVPVTALHGEQMLREEELPKRYVARSMCFRREAGAAGRDVKGLYRVHQFQKVEQVIVDVADEQKSIQHQLDILRNAEEILHAFGLPYRVVKVCGGDLGVGQIMKYDVECWMPSRAGFGETHSASRFYDYQARRLNLRYRRADNQKLQFCHTLNNTAVASPRILIPLLEIWQRPDGTVAVPDALVPYVGGRTVLGKAL